MNIAEFVQNHTYSDDDKIFITFENMTRKDYKQLNDIFTRFRGKWRGGRVNAHIFPEPILAETVRQAIIDGNVPDKNAYHLFPTPGQGIDALIEEVEPTANRLLQKRQLRFLEPSAGTGAIASRIREVWPNEELVTVEIDPVNIAILKNQGFQPIHTNFLTYEPDEQFDFILMNPPFNGNEFAKHILHAKKLVRKGGIVASVAPLTLKWKSGKLERELKDIVSCGGIWFHLDKMKFAQTKIETMIISFEIGEREKWFAPMNGWGTTRLNYLNMESSSDHEFYTEEQQMLERWQSIGNVPSSELFNLYNDWMTKKQWEHSYFVLTSDELRELTVHYENKLGIEQVIEPIQYGLFA